MAKLVSIESGSIVPLPGTSEPFDKGGVTEGKIITEKTWLIIDGDGITLTDRHGYQRIRTYKNHKLELNEKSNRKEKPLFFIKLRFMLGYRLQSFIAFRISYFRRVFQTIFRESHLSDYDLMSFDSYLAKLILPLIKAYRKQCLERGGLANNAHLELPQGETGDEKKDWLAVIDEIIFSLRWRLEVDMLEDTPEKIAFFKEYYGQYTASEDGWDKQKEQYNDSMRRAIKGLELFGRFFVRKSDVPDYGLVNLDISLAKRILPKIKAYRKMFLKRNKNLDVLNNAPHTPPQEYTSDEEKAYIADMSDGEKAWIAAIGNEEKGWLMNIDEIIYAMRWCLEVGMLNETPKKTAFFKEYYGQYVSPENDKDKSIEQYDDSLYRAKRGFMSFGWFLSQCGGYVRWDDGNPL